MFDEIELSDDMEFICDDCGARATYLTGSGALLCDDCLHVQRELVR